MRSASRATLTLGCVVSMAACGSDATMAPTHDHHTESPSMVRRVAGAVVSAFGRYIETPMGQQPTVNPSLRLLSPTTEGRVRRGEPVTIRVAYRDFDFRPELRTSNAGATLGSAPQDVVDGVVQGHMHGYLVPILADGSVPSAQSTSFCVLTRSAERTGYSGIAEGECPGVPAGDYRVSVEFQTNSHAAVLKNGPQAAPTADAAIVRVR